MTNSDHPEHVFLSVDELRHIITRTNIPPGQICIYKLVYQAGMNGITLRQLADQMREGDIRSMKSVLAALSSRIALTPNIPSTLPKPLNGVFFFFEGEGDDVRLRFFPEAQQAIESIPELLDIIQNLTIADIYERYPYDSGRGGLIVD